MPNVNPLSFRNNKRVALLVLAALLGNAGSASAGTWLPGDLTSYPQASWGGDPGIDAGAALLVSKFDTVYASTFGVTVGSFGGFTMSFTDAPSVLAYQPSIGPFAPLNGNVLNPISTSSGGFGGEVLGLEFNVDFSDAGFLPGSSGLRFGDLVLTGFPVISPIEPVNGLTVRQFLGDVNTLLGGGTSIVTIDDLGTVVGNLNGSFFDGVPSQFAQDHLVAPLPEPSTLILAALGGLVLLARRRRRH
jgi:hypothetical protein